MPPSDLRNHSKDRVAKPGGHAFNPLHTPYSKMAIRNMKYMYIITG